MSTLSRIPLYIALLFSCFALSARAEVASGNDFALNYTESRTPIQKKSMVDGAQGHPHYFRYLKIIEMQEVDRDGITGVQITAVEPSSEMHVKFTVTKPNSLSLLRETPESKVGDAIAVLGNLASVDAGTNSILLNSPIVREKDRLSPKVGKELLDEINPRAVVYSYTEGPRPVMVEARDQDILKYRKEILAKGGPKAWCEFLEKEIAKRRQQRGEAGATGGTGH